MDVLLNTPIPKSWTIACTQEGRIYFINDDLKTTTWLHPHFKQTVQSGHFSDQYVPDHCEKDFSEDNQNYYIDHIRKTTSWQIPTEKPLVSLAEPQKKSKAQASPLKRSNSAKRRSLKQKAPDARRNPNSVVVARNWLYRQEGGPGLLKSWKKRWCVLADLCLFVYKGPEEGSPLSSILLPSYNISSCPKDNHKFVFKVGHENVKSAYFSCESVKETEEWMGEMRLSSLAVQSSKEMNGGGGMGERNGECKSDVGDFCGSIGNGDGRHNGVSGGNNGTTENNVSNQGLMNNNVTNNLMEDKREGKSEMNMRNVPSMFVNNDNTNYINGRNDNMDEYNNPAIINDSKHNIKTVLKEFKNDMLTKHQENSGIGKKQQQNALKQQYAQQNSQQQQPVQNHNVVTPSSSYNNDRNIINNNLNNNYNPINNLNNNLELSSQTPQLNLTDYPRNNNTNNKTRQQLVDWSEDLNSSRVIERYELDQASVHDFSKEFLNKSQLKNTADVIEENNIENVDVGWVGHEDRGINKLNDTHDYTRNDLINGVSALNNVSSNDRNESSLNIQKGSESVKSGKMSEENLKKLPGSEKNSFKSGVIYPGVSNVVYPSQTSERFERVKQWTESQKKFNQENAKIGTCNEFLNYDTTMINQEELKNEFYLQDKQNKNELMLKGGQREEKDIHEVKLIKSPTGYNNDDYNVNGLSNINDLDSDLKNNANLVVMASKLYDCNETDEIVENLVKLRRAQYRLHEHSYNLISLSYKKPSQVDLKKQRMLLDSQMKESSEVIRKLESCLQVNSRNLSNDDLIHRQQIPNPNIQDTDAGLRVQTELNLNNKIKINPVIEDPLNYVLSHKKATISPKPHSNFIQPSFQPPLQYIFQPPSHEVNALLQQPQHSPLQQLQPLSPISHISNIDADIIRNKIQILPTNPQGFIDPNMQTSTNSNQPNLTNQQISGNYIETDLDLMRSINTAITNKEPKIQLSSQFVQPVQAAHAKMKPKTNYTATTNGMNNVLESNDPKKTNYFESNGLAKINLKNNDIESNSYMNDLIKRSGKTTPLNNTQADHITRPTVVSNDFNNIRGNLLDSPKQRANFPSNKSHFYQSPVNQRTSQYQQVPLHIQQPNSNQKTQIKAHENVKTNQQPSFKPFQPKSYPAQHGNYQQNHQDNLNLENFQIMNTAQGTQKALSQHPNLHTSYTNHPSQSCKTFRSKDEGFYAKSYHENHTQEDLNNNTNSCLNDNYRKYNDSNFISNDNNNYNFNNRNINSFNNNNFKDYNNNYNTQNHQPITNSTSQQPRIHSETEPKQQHIVRSFESKPFEASPTVPIEAIKDTMVRSDWNPMQASRSFQDLQKQYEEEEKEDNTIGGDDDGVIRGGLRNKRHIRRLSGIFTPRPFYKSNPSVGGDNDKEIITGKHSSSEVAGRIGVGSEGRGEIERNEDLFGDKVNKGTSETKKNNSAFVGDESRFGNGYNDSRINSYDDNAFDKAVVDVKSRPKENVVYGNDERNQMLGDGNRSENDSNGQCNNNVGYNVGGGNIEKWLNKRTENIKIIGNTINNSSPNSFLYSTKSEQFQMNSGNSFKMNTDDSRKHTDINDKYGNICQSKVTGTQNEFDIMSALQTPAQIYLPARTLNEPPFEDEVEDNDDNDLKRKEKTCQLTRLLAMQSMTDYSGGEDKRNIGNGGRMDVGAGINNQNNYNGKLVIGTNCERMEMREMRSNESIRNRFGEGGGIVNGRTSDREIGNEIKLRAEEERRRRQEVLNVKGELARQASFKARSERRIRD